MQYKYISSYVLVEGDTKWRRSYFITETLKELLETYSVLVLELSHPTLSRWVYLSSETMPQLRTINLTIEAFLGVNGNHTLQTTDRLNYLTFGQAFYQDLFRAGWTLYPTNLSVTHEQSTQGNQPDLRMTRVIPPPHDKEWDLVDIGKKILISINGFYHRHFATKDYIGIVNGYHLVNHQYETKKSLQPYAGITSFDKVGDIEIVDITEDMITPADDFQSLVNKCTINLDRDVSRFTPILILNGYMVYPDGDQLERNGTKGFNFIGRTYPLITRFLESANYVDYKDVGLTGIKTNKAVVSGDELVSEEYFKRLFTTSNSFLVLIKEPHVSFKKLPIQPEPYPYNYLSPYRPVYPIRVGNGRLMEYISIPFRNKWIIQGADGKNNNWINKTEYNPTPNKQVGNFTDDACLAWLPADYSQAHMLLIQRSTLVNKP